MDPGLSTSSSSSSSTSPTTTVSSDSETREREKLSGIDSYPVPVSSSNVEEMKERRDPLCSDIPEWLQELKENLVDDRVPEHRDSHASSFRGASLEPTSTKSEDLGKHNVHTHFPKDRNCEICQRTKITITRAEDALAEPYLVQKILVISLQQITKFSVKDGNPEKIIDMQSWCRTWPPNGSRQIRAEQKLLRKHKGACKSSWSQIGNLKSFTLTIPWNFGKACEDLSWNHCTSTPHRSETSGIAERAVRRVKEGTSAVLLQSGLNENWCADSMECYTCLRNVQDLVSDGKTPYERRFGKPFKGPIIPFGSLVEYYPISAKDQSRIHHFGKKLLLGLFLGYALYAGGEFGRATHWLQTLRSWKRWTHLKSTRNDSMQKRRYFPKKMENLFFQSKMDESNFLEEIKI